MSDPREVYLVTGANGCIGAWTIRRLLDRGSAVVALDVSPELSRPALICPAELLGQAHVVAADITDAESLSSILQHHRVTRILHLAALQYPFCRQDPARGAAVNVVGTVNVFEAARSVDHVRGIAYASSTGVFGPRDIPDAGPVQSNADAHPESLYGVYKVANEGTARVYWQEHGVRSVGLRPVIAYGVGRDQGLSSHLTKAMLAASAGRRHHIPFGGSIQLQHANDIAARLIHAVDVAPEGSPVYNSGGHLVSVARVAELIDDAVDQPGLVTYDDKPLPFPPEYDVDAVKNLGVPEETTLVEGISRTIEAFSALLAEGASLTEDGRIEKSTAPRLVSG